MEFYCKVSAKTKTCVRLKYIYKCIYRANDAMVASYQLPNYNMWIIEETTESLMTKKLAVMSHDVLV